MNLLNRFPNLYLIGSWIFLIIVALDNPTLAVGKLSEIGAYEKIIATDTELQKEISLAPQNAGDALTKVEQGELDRAGEAPLYSLNEAMPSVLCESQFASDEEETDFIQTDSEAREAFPVSSTAIAQTTLDDIPQEPTLTLEGQVTSVSQLTDVQPTDWAFEALRSLIERYGVIAGYPDSTLRGNRAMTRYEFAAALHSALERINELIAAGTAQQVSRDDGATLQRLQEEFAAELATLRGSVGGLEARTAELEANQFSTTTKLTGKVIMAVNGGGFEGDRIVDLTGRNLASRNPNSTFIYRATLDFATSFSGNDLLRLWIETGSADGSDNTAGFLEPNLGSVLDYSIKPPTDRRFGISRLNYTFEPLQDLTVSLGPVIVATDYVDRNSYANLSFRDFSTSAFANNFILLPVNGLTAGAAVAWNPGEGFFTLRALYTAADAANPGSQGIVTSVAFFIPLLYPNRGGKRGLFGDTYQGMVEMEYSPSNAFTARLQYSGGEVFNNRFEVFGANFEFKLLPQLAVFGRYGNGRYHNTVFGNINPEYWMAGMAFPDLFRKGALAGIAAGQPLIESGLGNATQMNFEAFYNFPITDNITLTPLVQVITNPGNQGSNGTIFTGTLRTVFSF